MSETLEVSLFPLHTVLFPEGPLPLRIFEPRYIDMVSACLKDDRPFGVALISGGSEVGEAAFTHRIGTLARIVDWHTRHDGLLGITCVGGQRFRIRDQRIEPNQLVRAQVELLPAAASLSLPADYYPLADLARNLMGRVGRWYEGLPTRFDDAAWVGYRLAELLPFPLRDKQPLLQLHDPLRLLERLSELLSDLGGMSLAES